MGAQLEGVSPGDITLLVTAASVRVAISIAAPNGAVGSAAHSKLETLASSTESLSAALGVTVKSVDAPPEIDGPVDASMISAIVGSLVGVAVLGLLVLALVRRRKHQARRPAIVLSSSGATSTSSVKVKLSSNGSPQRAHVTPPSLKRSSSGSQELLLWERPAASIGAPHVWSEHERELGRGSFGTVYRVECDGYAYAAKRFTVEPGAARQEIDQVLCREANALRKLKHPNIVRLMGIVRDDPTCLCLLMELAGRGSLRQLLDNNRGEVVNRPEVQLGIACDIASGMAYLHSQKPPILHRDLKSANVLLAVVGQARLTAKLGDFGLAVGFEGTAIGSQAKTLEHRAAGTLAYKAPEMFHNRVLTASEVFAMGEEQVARIKGEMVALQKEHGNTILSPRAAGEVGEGSDTDAKPGRAALPGCAMIATSQTPRDRRLQQPIANPTLLS